MSRHAASAAPRIVPFALYMLFVAVGEIPGLPFPADPTTLYPIKAGLPLLALLYYRKAYVELRWSDLARTGDTLLALGTGALVLLLWVHLDAPWATQGTLATGFDPESVASGAGRTLLVAARVAGASLVVPVMEELFWRSFLVRYILGKDFSAVPVGRLTPFAFAATALLFGLEHQLWVAGVLAGILYNLLLWRTKSIAQCILAHAATNAGLAVFVLFTRQWYFW